ncbi:ATP-binding cassette domain-containing protein [Nocardiopsis chromatogenes]|uniref:ATP-binding cassette domain-containing protein n=1 Tax=Nocardiopsis chromatogenes TaxID=280239 RepID=UPI0003453022|nr:ABC transporter ATP-binding protein [Nocardiopsis chromatogenes]
MTTAVHPRAPADGGTAGGTGSATGTTALDTRPEEPPRLLAGRRRWLFAALVAVGFAQAGAAVAWAALVARLAGGTSPLAALLPWAAGLVAATAALVFGERVLAERMGQSWVADVRTALFRRASAAPARQGGRGRSTGGASLRMMGNLSALRRWAGLGLARLAVALPLLAGCLVAFTVIAPPVAAAVGAVAGAGLAATAALSPWLRSAHRAARRRQARVAAHVVERIGKTPVVQAFGRERAERRVLARRSANLAREQVRRARAVGAVRAVGEATTLAATAAALVAAAAAGTGPAQATAAIAVVGIMVTPLRDLSRVSEYRSGCAVAMRQIRTELARPKRRRPGASAPRLPDGGGALDLEEVRVDGVFAPVAAHVPAGSVVAVTGPNGSGKSTLMAVLAGLLPPDGGRVLLDGGDVNACRASSVRRAVGVVGPDLPLLRGTVGSNVRYADPRVGGARFRAAVASGGLDPLIAELPMGLQTPVREDGGGLSAGQRQRVALARALLNRPRLLLLDEADAHLDTEAAGVIDEVVADFPGTVVIVTHRPERLASADTVWRLGGGLLRTGAAGSGGRG